MKFIQPMHRTLLSMRRYGASADSLVDHLTGVLAPNQPLGRIDGPLQTPGKLWVEHALTRPQIDHRTLAAKRAESWRDVMRFRRELGID